LRIADCGFLIAAYNEGSSIRNPQSAIPNQEMNDPNDKDFVAEYQALKAANDRLRERGRLWLWEMLEAVCSEASRELAAQNDQPLQTGRQEWQFKVGSATMVGERFGARFREKTLIIEAGWPREPEHGFVSDGGLARARIGLSGNVMLEAQTIAEMIFKKQSNREPAWYFIANKEPGELVTESRLRQYLNLVLVN
jgi:hypothetical protein